MKLFCSFFMIAILMIAIEMEGLARTKKEGNISVLRSPTLPIRGPSTLVKVTIYQGISIQTDSSPNITSIGAVFDPHNPPKWVAVSRDLLKVYEYGSFVEISGIGVLDGVYKVMDTMHKSKRRHVDILVPARVKKGDSAYGSWKSIRVTKIKF